MYNKMLSGVGMEKNIYSFKHQIKEAELNGLSLIGSTFENFNQQNLRTYVKTIHHLDFHQEIKESFSIMLAHTNKSTSLQIVKLLSLVHITLQQTLKEEQLLMLIVNKVSKLTEKDEKKLVKIKSECSLEKTFKWIQSQFSKKSKEKKDSLNRSLSSRKKEQSLSKEEFLNEKIIKPYIAYLLKSLSSVDFYNKIKKEQVVELEELWIVVNLFTYLFGVTESFPTLYRYYMREYQVLVNQLTKIMSRQISFLYPFLKKNIETHRQKIKRGYNKHKKLIENKEQFVNYIVPAFHIEQMFKILLELDKINEKILFILHCKQYSIFNSDDSQVLQNILHTETPSYDFIHKVCRVYQKKNEKGNYLKTLTMTTIPTLPDEEMKLKQPLKKTEGTKCKTLKDLKKKVIKQNRN